VSPAGGRVGIVPLGLQSRAQFGAERTVVLEGTPDVNGIACHGPGNWAATVERSGTAAAPVFTVRLRGDLSEPRAFDDTLSLVPISVRGKPLSAVPIRFVGELVSDVVPLPRSLPFGRLRVGEAREEVIRLRSLSSQSFTLVDAVAHGVGLTATRDPAALEPTVVVRVVASHEGHQTGRVVLAVSSTPDGRHSIDIPVTLHGYRD
jgi:hypothetical protein